MYSVELNLLEWEMLTNGEKWVLFVGDNEFLNLGPSVTFILKNTNDTLGTATIYKHSTLLYEPTNEDETPVPIDILRNGAILHLFNEWREKFYGLTNEESDWSNSKEFVNYLDQIGWGNNYAIFLNDIKQITNI